MDGINELSPEETMTLSEGEKIQKPNLQKITLTLSNGEEQTLSKFDPFQKVRRQTLSNIYCDEGFDNIYIYIFIECEVPLLIPQLLAIELGLIALDIEIPFNKSDEIKLYMYSCAMVSQPGQDPEEGKMMNVAVYKPELGVAEGLVLGAKGMAMMGILPGGGKHAWTATA